MFVFLGNILGSKRMSAANGEKHIVISDTLKRRFISAENIRSAIINRH